MSYTWSKARTDANGYNYQPMNSYNLRGDWGPSNYNRNHILVLSYVYPLPFWKVGREWYKVALGGWQVSGVTTLQTGIPFNVTIPENGKLVSYGDKPDDYGTDVYSRKTVDFVKRAAKAGQPFFAYVSLYAPHSPAVQAPRHATLFPDAKAPRTPNFNEADVRGKPSFVHDSPRLTDK